MQETCSGMHPSEDMTLAQTLPNTASTTCQSVTMSTVIEFLGIIHYITVTSKTCSGKHPREDMTLAQSLPNIASTTDQHCQNITMSTVIGFLGIINYITVTSYTGK